jgi:hypothetical protein
VNDTSPANTENHHDQKLSELRSKRAALEAAREKRALEAELAEETLREERALADAEAIDAAEREHGLVGKRIMVIQTELGAVIVKRAHANTFRKFMDGGKHSTADLEKLIRPCLVHPPLEQFEAIIKEQPFTLNRVSDAIATLAGVRAEDVSGKS